VKRKRVSLDKISDYDVAVMMNRHFMRNGFLIPGKSQTVVDVRTPCVHALSDNSVKV
jgi:hypothetical protein